MIKVGDTGRTPQLPENLRLIAVEQSEQRPLLYCPSALLDREQLDLIDVVGNTLAIDRLLPTKLVAEGDSWPNDEAVMRALFTLDTVAVCEVQSVLDSCNESYAKIRLEGVVHGLSDGAAVEQDVRGVYLFDRRSRRVTRLNLAVREKRSIGGATPGLRSRRQTANRDHAHQGIRPPHRRNRCQFQSAKVVCRPSDLTYESLPLGFRFQHDRNWYITAEAHESVTLRRVDNGDLAAQCTITLLPSKSTGRQTSLDEFQKDITFSLGKSFGELVSSRQWQNAAGLHCYEVVVRGLVEELPVEWHYYLAAPDSGPRVSVAVTIEKPMVERVAAPTERWSSRCSFSQPCHPPKRLPNPAARTSNSPPDLR